MRKFSSNADLKAFFASFSKWVIKIQGENKTNNNKNRDKKAIHRTDTSRRINPKAKIE